MSSYSAGTTKSFSSNFVGQYPGYWNVSLRYAADGEFSRVLVFSS